jgi:RNA polymerase sigma-70 factor (ECF subfamily)
MTTVLLHPTVHATATDEQLVELVRSGDDRAFDAIHDRYRARLVAYARQILGGAHHDAEEVVQDAFVRALGAIVRNRALDVLRRPARTTDLTPHIAVLYDASADPHERMLCREKLDALVGDLKELPSRQRTALLMHELGGSSHESIARTLRVSAGGSKALVSRARAGLAKARAAA